MDEVRDEVKTRMQLVGEYALQHMHECPDLDWSSLLGFMLWLSIRDGAKSYVLNKAKIAEKIFRGTNLMEELSSIQHITWCDWVAVMERVEGRSTDPETNVTRIAMYLAAEAMAAGLGVNIGSPVLDSTEAMPITNRILQIRKNLNEKK